MKSNGIVRIESLRLQNFKNITSCEISFDEAKKLSRGEFDEDEFSSVLGLYGQNGSGKTSCIQGFRMIQYLLSGVSLKREFVDFIKNGASTMSVGADFLVQIKNKNFFVKYDCMFEKNEEGLQINEEKISYKEINDGTRKINVYDFKVPGNINLSFKEYLGAKNFEIYKTIASFDSKTSFNQFNILSSIFNPKLISFIAVTKNDEYSLLINELQYFALYRFAIYQINYFNEIPNTGIRIRIKEEECETPSCNDVFVSFNETIIKAKYFPLFKKTIDSINKVLPSIIKDLTVQLVDVVQTKKQVVNIIDDVVNFRLMSKKGKYYVPLHNESNGIKKIISILSGLIDAFNNEGTFIAIDELDSGIFEYLLGELVYAFDNFANGQMFFTSHNLRILEKINSKSIYFSTTNEEEKFIQVASVRDTNNLRNLYYKYIANGYKNKYSLYNNVKTANIIAAFAIDKEGSND